MTEQTLEKDASVPVIGPGSSRGARWFVSCRYPDMSVTIRPALDKTDTLRADPGTRVVLQRFTKPNQFVGDGRLGKFNPTGTDLNDSPYWGIYLTHEPGPEPEDGYVDDDKSVPRIERLSAARKKELREELDRLRDTHFYRSTVQDNQVDRECKLKELDWDPTALSGTLTGFVARGKQPITKESVVAAKAPAEERAPVPAPVVPRLSRPTKK